MRFSTIICLQLSRSVPVGDLTEAERATLLQTVAALKAAARTMAHVPGLLKADEAPGAPGWTGQQMVEAFEGSLSTVGRFGAFC